MYVITVSFDIDPAYYAEFLREMCANARQSRELEPGCITFDVCEETDKPCGVFLYEVYESKAAFEAHLKSLHFLRFDQIVRSWVKQKVVKSYQLIVAT